MALGALSEHIGPKVVDRLGLRYIDRLVGQAVDDIAKLVRSEVIGVFATPMAAQAGHALSESLFAVPDAKAQLLARWGRVPPHGTVDPAALEPVAEPIDAAGLVAEARTYAERIYTFFRWAVTDEFLRRYGGNI